MEVTIYYQNRHGNKRFKVAENVDICKNELNTFLLGVAIGIRTRYRGGTVSAVYMTDKGEEITVLMPI